MQVSAGRTTDYSQIVLSGKSDPISCRVTRVPSNPALKCYTHYTPTTTYTNNNNNNNNKSTNIYVNTFINRSQDKSLNYPAIEIITELDRVTDKVCSPHSKIKQDSNIKNKNNSYNNNNNKKKNNNSYTMPRRRLHSHVLELANSFDLTTSQDTHDLLMRMKRCTSAERSDRSDRMRKRSSVREMAMQYDSMVHNTTRPTNDYVNMSDVNFPPLKNNNNNNNNNNSDCNDDKNNNDYNDDNNNNNNINIVKISNNNNNNNNIGNSSNNSHIVMKSLIANALCSKQRSNTDVTVINTDDVFNERLPETGQLVSRSSSILHKKRSYSSTDTSFICSYAMQYVGSCSAESYKDYLHKAYKKLNKHSTKERPDFSCNLTVYHNYITLHTVCYSDLPSTVLIEDILAYQECTMGHSSILALLVRENSEYFTYLFATEDQFITNNIMLGIHQTVQSATTPGPLQNSTDFYPLLLGCTQVCPGRSGVMQVLNTAKLHDCLQVRLELMNGLKLYPFGRAEAILSCRQKDISSYSVWEEDRRIVGVVVTEKCKSMCYVLRFNRTTQVDSVTCQLGKICQLSFPDSKDRKKNRLYTPAISNSISMGSIHSSAGNSISSEDNLTPLTSGLSASSSSQSISSMLKSVLLLGTRNTDTSPLTTPTTPISSSISSSRVNSDGDSSSDVVDNIDPNVFTVQYLGATQVESYPTDEESAISMANLCYRTLRKNKPGTIETHIKNPATFLFTCQEKQIKLKNTEKSCYQTRNYSIRNLICLVAVNNNNNGSNSNCGDLFAMIIKRSVNVEARCYFFQPLIKTAGEVAAHVNSKYGLNSSF